MTALMTKKQIAHFLSVSTRTIERWQQADGFPYRRIGGVNRYDLVDVMAWVDRERPE